MFNKITAKEAIVSTLIETKRRSEIVLAAALPALLVGTAVICTTTALTQIASMIGQDEEIA